MRRAAKITLGILFAPVGLVVLGLLAFGALRAAGVPDPDVGAERLEQPLPETTRTTLESRTEDRAPIETPETDDAIRVELDLVEGMFRVEPHDGEDIEVDARYDRASYALERDYGLDGEVPVFRLLFRSKVHWLRRIAQDGGIDDGDFGANEITVYLPRGVPIDLRAKISRSETEFVLDGLTLTNLVTDMGMGQYTVECGEPNPVVMRNAVFDVGMGEATLRGLSNLRPRRIEVKGGMGEIEVDMGTSLRIDTELHASMRMGELRLELPDDALLDIDSEFGATLGEVDDRGVRNRRIEDPERAHHFRVTGSVFMGALVVDQFRARGAHDDLR
ncbi:MAG TPA: hypothetical protein VKA86_09770 [Candidatus Krumholzibacteria bacterium]|nr:hypothetical protein [Candidatus Krumholzibacteria bacterium]